MGWLKGTKGLYIKKTTPRLCPKIVGINPQSTNQSSQHLLFSNILFYPYMKSCSLSSLYWHFFFFFYFYQCYFSLSLPFSIPYTWTNSLFLIGHWWIVTLCAWPKHHMQVVLWKNVVSNRYTKWPLSLQLNCRMFYLTRTLQFTHFVILSIA